MSRIPRRRGVFSQPDVETGTKKAMPATKEKVPAGDPKAATAMKLKDSPSNKAMEMMARADRFDMASCAVGRLMPKPVSGVQKAWYAMKVIKYILQIAAIIFLGLELGDVWSQGPMLQRIWTGIYTLDYIVMWLLTFAGAVAGVVNEQWANRQFKKAFPNANVDAREIRRAEGEAFAEDEKDLYVEAASGAVVQVARVGLEDFVNKTYQFQDALASRGKPDSKPLIGGDGAEFDIGMPPAFNWPALDHGLTYHTVFLTGYCVVFAYLWTYINNGYNLAVDTQDRGFRVYVWLFFGLLILDFTWGLVHYFQMLHVAIGSMYYGDMDDASCAHTGCNIEIHKNYPKIAFYKMLAHLSSEAGWMGAFAAVLFLGEQLTGGDQNAVGTDMFWNEYGWQVFNFVTWIIAGTMAFGALVIRMFILGDDEECVKKTYSKLAALWLGVWGWAFGVWFKQFQDAGGPSENRESYMWVSLILYADYLFLVLFHDFRCFVAKKAQLFFCPNFHGL